MTGGQGREVLFEFIQAGPQMRVAALDPESGVEVVVITPVTATRAQMQALALAKLQRRLAGDSQLPPRRPPGKYA